LQETEPQFDQYGIRLTSEVVAARKAADQLDSLKYGLRNSRMFIYSNLDASCSDLNGTEVDFPEGFVEAIVAALRIIGSGNSFTIVPHSNPEMTPQMMEYAKSKARGAT
jgi:hypothetical protein